MIKACIHYSPVFILLSALFIGLFPQSAADPLMMAPFALLSCFLILSNGLLKLQSNDIILFLLVILWLLWGLSSLHSVIPFPSRVTWVLMTTLPVAYMVARTSDVKQTPLNFLSLLIIPFAVYTIWQAAHGIKRPNAPFDDSNLLGLLFTFGLLAIPSLPDVKGKKIISILAAVILAAALIATQSRSAVLALICGIAIYALLNKNLRQISLSKDTWFKLSGAAALILIAIFASGFWERFKILKGGMIDPNITGRLTIWRGAFHMSLDHPLLGWGIGTFHLHYPSYRMAGDNSLGWMVHMDPLQQAVESGWAAPALLYAIFAAAAYFIYKNHKAYTPTQKSAAAILASIFIGMHLNYPLQVMPFLIVFALTLSTLSPSRPDQGKSVPMVVAGCLLLTVIFALWISTKAALTFMYAAETQKSFRLQDQDRFNKAMMACINDGDKDFPDCRIMAARFLTLARDKDWERIENLLSEAERANPVNAEVDYIRAQRLMFLDPPHPDEALPRLKHSLSLNPSYWPSRRLLIDLLVKKGDKTSARSILDEGLIYRYARPTIDDISRVRKSLEQK